MKRSDLFSRNDNLLPGSSCHDFRLSVISLIPVGVLGLIVFLALFPVSITAVGDSSIFNINYTHDQLKFRFCAEHTEPFITAAAVLLGIAASVRLFSFMQDKSRSAFYFSLGISRRKLYLVRTAACLIVSAFSVTIPVLISLVLNLKALGTYEGIVLYVCALILIVFLQTAAGVMIGQIGCFFAGSAGELFLAAATASVAPSVFFSFLNILMKTFLWGNVYDAYSYSGTRIKEGLLSGMSMYNPVCFSYKLIQKYDAFSRTMENSKPDPVNWAPILIWMSFLVLFFAGLYLVFETFKAERSGISGLFRLTKASVSVIWPCAAFTVVLKTLQSTGTVISFTASVACAILLFVVIGGVYSMKSMRFSLWVSGIAGILLFFIISAGVMKTGLLGLYDRIPDGDQVESAEISYVGDPSFIPDQCSITQNGHSIYSTGTVTLESPEAVRAVLDLERKMSRQGRAALFSSGNSSETVYPYDIQIRWKDKTGRQHQRYYDRIRASVLTEFLKLEETEELKKQSQGTIQGLLSHRLWNSEAFLNGDIYISDSWMSSIKHITLSDEMRSMLLRAAADDFAKQNTIDRYHPKTDQKGFIFFTLNGAADLKNLKCGTAQTRIYYTDEYGDVLSLLDQWNAFPDTVDVVSSGEICEAQIQKFDPYSGMNRLISPVSLFFSEYRTESDEDFVIGQDFGTRPAFSDPEQIRKLAEASVSSAYMDDSGCLAVFIFKNGTCVYRYIPYDSEPEFIKSKIN